LDRRYLLITVVLLATIYGLSSIPDIHQGGGPALSLVFNMLHAPLFGAVAWCCYRTFGGARGASLLPLVVTLSAAIACAVFDEWHQSFVLGRSASITDLGVDLVGIVVTVAVIGREPLRRLVRPEPTATAPDRHTETSP
jgi:VanZ like protein